jgi:hypothetical protein
MLAGSVVGGVAIVRASLCTSAPETVGVGGGTLASGPIGVVPGDTEGRFETGSPDTGETPGRAGATVSPGGKLPGAVARALFGLPGDSVLSTERLGIDELVLGTAGATVVPLVVVLVPAAFVELVPLDGAAVALDPLVAAPGAAPELPLPEPEPAWARMGTSGAVPHSAARRRKRFEFMAWCERLDGVSDAPPAAGERWRPRSDRPKQKTFVPDG